MGDLLTIGHVANTLAFVVLRNLTWILVLTHDKRNKLENLLQDDYYYYIYSYIIFISFHLCLDITKYSEETTVLLVQFN